MKIALFGGSFNPIHMGHVKLAEFSVHKLGIDKLIFIPAYKSLDKLNFKYESPEHRCNLIKLSMPENTHISTFEIEQGQPVPSYITVEYFSSLYPDDELFFLIGEDNLETLDSWEGIEKIVDLAIIVVWKRFSDQQAHNSKFLDQFMFLDNPIFPHSSSSVRIDKNNLMLDTKVFEYIKKNSLYGF